MAVFKTNLSASLASFDTLKFQVISRTTTRATAARGLSVPGEGSGLCIRTHICTYDLTYDPAEILNVCIKFECNENIYRYLYQRTITPHALWFMRLCLAAYIICRFRKRERMKNIKYKTERKMKFSEEWKNEAKLLDPFGGNKSRL